MINTIRNITVIILTLVVILLPIDIFKLNIKMSSTQEYLINLQQNHLNLLMCVGQILGAPPDTLRQQGPSSYFLQ